MPASILVPLLEAVKTRLPRVVDVPEPADGDVEQLHNAVMAVLAAGKDSRKEHLPSDLQDVLHITSKLWVQPQAHTCFASSSHSKG